MHVYNFPYLYISLVSPYLSSASLSMSIYVHWCLSMPIDAYLSLDPFYLISSHLYKVNRTGSFDASTVVFVGRGLLSPSEPRGHSKPTWWLGFYKLRLRNPDSKLCFRPIGFFARWFQRPDPAAWGVWMPGPGPKIISGSPRLHCCGAEFHKGNLAAWWLVGRAI